MIKYGFLIIKYVKIVFQITYLIAVNHLFHYLV